MTVVFMQCLVFYVPNEFFAKMEKEKTPVRNADLFNRFVARACRSPDQGRTDCKERTPPLRNKRDKMVRLNLRARVPIRTVVMRTSFVEAFSCPEHRRALPCQCTRHLYTHFEAGSLTSDSRMTVPIFEWWMSERPACNVGIFRWRSFHF